jgi:hypothetical protein
MPSNSGSFTALTKCFFCGQDSDILLHKNMRDISHLHGKVTSMQPCAQCERFMEKGIILIGIEDDKSESGWSHPPSHLTDKQRQQWIPNPYRSGAFVVVKDDALEEIITPAELFQWAKKHRWMFIEHSALERMGALEHATHDG